jgi:hypothetical protein
MFLTPYVESTDIVSDILIFKRQIDVSFTSTDPSYQTATAVTHEALHTPHSSEHFETFKIIKVL